MLLQPITVPFSKSTPKPSVYTLKTVTKVTKILTCYISVTVPDRPIVTIIHR